MTINKKPLNPYSKISLSLPVTVRTLTAGGFFLQGAHRNPNYVLIYASRPDEFGVSHEYCFSLPQSDLTKTDLIGAQNAAKHNNSTLVVIGDTSDSSASVEWDKFINLFGGPVLSSSPFESKFNDQLIELSHNKLPSSLKGKPDDLFEIYVHAALEFILGGRVVRWGQNRRFEKIPDGLAIPDVKFSALYDAKAYEKGYEISEDTIRQFKSYVDDFKAKYSAYYTLNTFIVISSDFPHKKETLLNRSQELQAACGIPLSFLDSTSLVEILKIFTKKPLFRRSINWTKIFTKVVVSPSLINNEIKSLNKDGIIARQ